MSDLRAVFVANVPKASQSADVSAVTEGDLLGLYQRGEQAWPTVHLPAAAFVAALARHVTANEPVATFLHSVQAADLYLACACAAGQASALRVFDEQLLSKVPAFLAKGRSRLSDAYIDDVRQNLREKLLVARPGQLPKIAEYAGRGTLQGWVRVAAVRTSVSMGRNRDEAPKDEVQEERLVTGPSADAEIEFIKTRYQKEFQDAFAAAFAQLDSEGRNLLRLNLVDGLNIEKIGLMLGVHRATVARRIAAARDAVLNGVREYFRTRLKISASQMDSLSHLVQSQLHVSVVRLLTEEQKER